MLAPFSGFKNKPATSVKNHRSVISNVEFGTRIIYQQSRTQTGIGD
jgi:hypothetical protein